MEIGSTSDFLRLQVGHVQNLLGLSASFLTLFGTVIAAIMGLYFGSRSVPEETEVGAEPREQTRISQAIKELQRQESAERWSRRVSGTLTVGQYMVGAALASAFVQASMPEFTAGILGIVVLFSQVIQQRFRPDIRSIGARERATYLRQLIRDAEDALFANASNLDGAVSIHDIRLTVSQGLSEVDRLETMELTTRTRAQQEPRPKTSSGG